MEAINKTRVFLQVATSRPSDDSEDKRNNCNDQQDVNQAGDAIVEDAQQPSYNQDYGDDIQNTSHVDFGFVVRIG